MQHASWLGCLFSFISGSLPDHLRLSYVVAAWSCCTIAFRAKPSRAIAFQAEPPLSQQRSPPPRETASRATAALLKTTEAPHASAARPSGFHAIPPFEAKSRTEVKSQTRPSLFLQGNDTPSKRRNLERNCEPHTSRAENPVAHFASVRKRLHRTFRDTPLKAT